MTQPIITPNIWSSSTNSVITVVSFGSTLFLARTVDKATPMAMANTTMPAKFAFCSEAKILKKNKLAW
eukprot:CAMPEP_0178876340 /NCGR_PEP_ID=MMETSP0747-20121128/10243_1 /TAXON_ID=913974 /ORGANISM="Nitzschia punctata, Strain CCMP561" /LENGTH=67 /DNA_ID=CAMNT_0020543891 /DNA_START=36 /DNA_END=236 /DNA_ORIENTATION=-